MPSFTPAPSGNATYTVDENGNVIFNDAGADGNMVMLIAIFGSSSA